MRTTIWTGVVAIAMAFVGMVPQAAAAVGDSITFTMVRNAGATCLSNDAHGRVTVSDLGSVQNLHVEVFALPANTNFTLFVINTPKAPFVPAWYQGDLKTNAAGKGVADVTGIFSEQTFILNPGIPAVPVEMDHLGIWFADSTDAANAGCPGGSTPFDGDHQAGIQVLNTSNFRDDRGPLRQLRKLD